AGDAVAVEAAGGLVVAVVGVLGLVLQRIEGLEKFDAMIKTTLRRILSRQSVDPLNRKFLKSC
ncbi:hypothetical protein, partial [Pseudomonas monteilii]